MLLRDPRWWLCVVASLFLARGVTFATPESVLEVGFRKQLFVDDFVVAEKNHVSRELGRVTKENGGEPIFTGAHFYGSVHYDEGRFKMWCSRADRKNYLYTESTDGVHFDSPREIVGVNFFGDINMAVMIDPHETDPAHRYKAGFDCLPGPAAGLAYSEDGIHWAPYNNGVSVTYRAADTYNQIVWDEDAKTYRLFTRTDFGGGRGPKAGTASKEVEVRGTRSMTNPDVKRNPTDWKLVRHWIFDREGPQEFRRRQIYALTDTIYHGVHFGTLSVYEWPSDFSEGEIDYHMRHERDVMNYYIATSRDANEWDLQWVYAQKPIVPRGGDGAFDKDGILPGATILTARDRHWLYYGGLNERHGDPTRPIKHEAAIGLATIRLDGLIYLRAANDADGVVVTRPFRLEGPHLEVNVDCRGGEFSVEVLDASGAPIVGFGPGAANRYRSLDHLRLRPRWKDHADLTEFVGRVIRLKFRLRGSNLYAFQVRP